MTAQTAAKVKGIIQILSTSVNPSSLGASLNTPAVGTISVQVAVSSGPGGEAPTIGVEVFTRSTTIPDLVLGYTPKTQQVTRVVAPLTNSTFLFDVRIANIIDPGQASIQSRIYALSDGDNWEIKEPDAVNGGRTTVFATP
ncbi:MAG: hypothetical protein H7039_18720 [Bryobacteraceae bacterium]|nr:hypothetical protein [Bryobacteraceae bacterium]